MSLKANRPCMDCGLIFHPVCMDFDHRPGETKKSGISQLTKHGRSNAVIMAEVAKCDLVCAVCHRLRTHTRKQQAIQPVG